MLRSRFGLVLLYFLSSQWRLFYLFLLFHLFSSSSSVELIFTNVLYINTKTPLIVYGYVFCMCTISLSYFNVFFFVSYFTPVVVFANCSSLEGVHKKLVFVWGSVSVLFFYSVRVCGKYTDLCYFAYFALRERRTAV